MGSTNPYDFHLALRNSNELILHLGSLNVDEEGFDWNPNDFYLGFNRTHMIQLAPLSSKTKLKKVEEIKEDHGERKRERGLKEEGKKREILTGERRKRRKIWWEKEMERERWDSCQDISCQHEIEVDLGREISLPFPSPNVGYGGMRKFFSQSHQ